MWCGDGFKGRFMAPDVPLLCIWRRVKGTTIFPAASTSSRSFNRTLWRAIGHAMGVEGRALFNLGMTSDLSLRGPQLNIQRDPRWGRNSNSPSEDPFLTGSYGQEIIQGMQGQDKFRLVGAQMKHWTAVSICTTRALWVASDPRIHNH